MSSEDPASPESTPESFRHFFELSVDLLSIVDLEGRFAEVNPAWERTLGWRRQELLGRRYIDLVHPDDVARTEAEAAQYLAEGASALFENRYRCRDGSYRWLAWQAHLARGEGRFYAVARDATARKAAEAERELLLRLALALSEAEDLEAALALTLQRVCEATHWAVGEAWLLDPSRRRLVPGRAWYASRRALVRAGEALGAFRAATPDGFAEGEGLAGTAWALQRPVWMRDVSSDPAFTRAELAREAGLQAAVAIPVISHGQVEAVLTFFTPQVHDEDPGAIRTVSAVAAQLGTVVAQRQADERVRESQAALARSNEALERFASRAAHDLHEPLRAVTGFLGLFLRRHGETVPDAGRDLLDHALAGAERMQGRLDGLRELARVEAEGGPMRPVDLDELLADVQADLAGELDGATVDIGELPWVTGDREQLRALFRHLLANALRSHNGGAPRIRITATEDDQGWEIVVTDDGPGIPTDQRERVLDPFAKLDPDAPGTGVGLTVAARIAERHGGRLTIDGDGSGCVVRLRLPAG